MVPAQAAEDHGAEGGPDGEPATRPHQRQRRAVRGPPEQTVKRRITRFLTPLHLAKNIYLLGPFGKTKNDFPKLVNFLTVNKMSEIKLYTFS